MSDQAQSVDATSDKGVFRFTVAIDGPAAAGKGTIARQLSQHFGFAHLDTGLLYRRVALETLKLYGDHFTRDNVLSRLGNALESLAEESELRSSRVSKVVPAIAALPEVRAALVAFQRSFARQKGGAVLDGRDIGTVICPEAEVKLFVTAEDATRAERRLAELVVSDPDLTLADVLDDLRARDRRDSERATAPLRPAPDALVLDTTLMTIEEAVAAAIAAVDLRLSRDA